MPRKNKQQETKAINADNEESLDIEEELHEVRAEILTTLAKNTDELESIDKK